MNKWGAKSQAERATCDTRLNLVGDVVLQIKDHSVIKGHRNKEDQNAAFDAGHSQLRWPDGKHNSLPCKAQDVRAYPWPDDEQAQREEQLYLLGLYKGVGHMKGIKIRTGADWDRDGEIADNGFDDFFHVEIDE
jgi:peptidoglycan L-alanyl-D-glutamate endopeptidase CwlK